MIERIRSARGLVLRLALVTAALSVAACEESDDDTSDQGARNPVSDAGVSGSGFSGSCRNIPDAPGTCIDYVGSSYTVASVRSGCAALNATYSSSACTDDDLAGTCLQPNGSGGGVDLRTETFYDSSLVPAEVMEACSLLGGTFVAGTTGSCRDTNGIVQISGDAEERTMYQAESVSYGSSCVSELQYRTCEDGTWGAWSGTYTYESCAPEEGACEGTPAACATFGQSACGDQGGCSWTTPSASCQSTTPDFAYNCSNWTYYQNASQVCPSIPGCYWTGSSCAGGVHTCEEHFMTACGELDSLGFPCEWGATPSCSGTATSCASYQAPATCGAQSGCSWG